MIKLVCMGKLGSLLPPDWEAVPLPTEVHTLAGLRAWLAQALPDLGAAIAQTSVKAIVNLSVAHNMATPIRDGDEIAFMPPMSGG